MIEFEDDALVVLIGHMGVGKSTWSNKYFLPHQIVSTDNIREQLTGDFENQDCNDAVFPILFKTIEERAKLGYFTLVDCTGSGSVLQHLCEMKKTYGRPIHAVRFEDLAPEDITKERMQHRMKYLSTMERQQKRIRRVQIPKAFKTHQIPRNTDVKARIMPSNDRSGWTLDPAYNWIAIPDLHGEHEFLRKLLGYVDETYSADKYRLLFLGDIVDRGASSYETFKMVWDRIRNHGAAHTTSNHDYKFYRWLNKWKADADPRKYGIFASIEHEMRYGMTLSYGLSGTVQEFLQLPRGERQAYCDDFIEYFESASPFLKLERDDHDVFFAHASVNERMVQDLAPNKKDKSDAMFRIMEDVADVEQLSYLRDKGTVVVLGHHVVEEGMQSFYHEHNTQGHLCELHKLDFGLGKFGWNESHIAMTAKNIY